MPNPSQQNFKTIKISLAEIRWSYVALHAMVIGASNYFIQFPFGPWPEALTWAAFIAPCAFFITDLCNRRYGVAMTKKVVCVSFLFAVLASFVISDPRIAFASGLAFLASQWMDATIFNRLRRQTWWMAPTVSGVIASGIDCTLFFTIAFYESNLPWVNWALADYVIKVTMILVILPVYGLVIYGDRTYLRG